MYTPISICRRYILFFTITRRSLVYILPPRPILEATRARSPPAPQSASHPSRKTGIPTLPTPRPCRRRTFPGPTMRLMLLPLPLRRQLTMMLAVVVMR